MYHVNITVCFTNFMKQVVKSIGYKSVCIDPDIPFDQSKCVVPNIDGRVTGYPGKLIIGPW